MNFSTVWAELRTHMSNGRWTAEQMEAWTQGTWTVHPSKGLCGVTQDTRSLAPGDLYVAIRGERMDGHRFVDAAFEAGAAAALVDREWAASCMSDRPCLVVENTREALIRLASHHRAAWSTRVIGVTGSVGKTTVKELLADMLENLGTVCRTRGNYNNEIGLPLSMLAARGYEDFGVFEVAMNQPGEIAPLTDLVQPRVAVMTPVGSAHIGQFENEEALALEKAAMLERVHRKGFSVLSADLPWFNLLAARSAAPVVTVALEGPANWTGAWVEDAFEIQLEGNPVLTCRLPVQADFMARNVLLCTAAACRLGVSGEQIQRAIEGFRAPGMRWQESTWAGIHLINDCYNANPLSMQASLSGLARCPGSGRKWAVLGGMHELGDGEVQAHEDLGASLVNFDVHCVAVGARAGSIVDGALKAGVSESRVFRAPTCSEAVEVLRSRVHAGDTVLFKASRGEKLELLLEEWMQQGGEG